MQEHTRDNTVPTTGRGYNRHTTDAENSATGAATDLYAPVPGDDDNSRPGETGAGTRTSTTGTRDRTDLIGRENEAEATSQQRWDETRRSPASTNQSDWRRKTQTDGGLMNAIQSNPLAVVAAATAGGMLVGRLMRRRDHRRDEGYLRNTSQRGYQGYQPYQPQQSYGQFQGQFQGRGDYQGYQDYQPPQSYGPAGYRGAPQYRADEGFLPGSTPQSSHENFPGGSNWD